MNQESYEIFLLHLIDDALEIPIIAKMPIAKEVMPSVLFSLYYRSLNLTVPNMLKGRSCEVVL